MVYAAKGNQWVGFDNQRSYDAKVRSSLWNLDQISLPVTLTLCPLIGGQVAFLNSRQLGGAAVWTLDMDDFSGQFCGQGSYPLISHLKVKLSPGETTGVLLCWFQVNLPLMVSVKLSESGH